jgi:hypothetical protein
VFRDRISRQQRREQLCDILAIAYEILMVMSSSIPIEVDLREQDALGVEEFDIRLIHSSVILNPHARLNIPISDRGVLVSRL